MRALRRSTRGTAALLFLTVLNNPWMLMIGLSLFVELVESALAFHQICRLNYEDGSVTEAKIAYEAEGAIFETPEQRYYANELCEKSQGGKLASFFWDGRLFSRTKFEETILVMGTGVVPDEHEDGGMHFGRAM